MYTALRKSLNKENDKGFTLIELLVVIIIIGILAAIAIPIFLNQRKKAVDASQKSDVRTIATQMETAFTDTQTYPTAATLSGGGLNLGIGLETVRMSPANVPYITVNATLGAFCVQVTNPNSSRTPPAGYVWRSDLGGLQSDPTVTSCPAAGGGWIANIVS
jgi:prepilin-type N-terminal cleavage/methylation domain-containing protein